MGFFLLLSGSLAGQSFFFKIPEMDENMKGLSIHKIFLDKNGYLWLASSRGLIEYDGLSFEIFEKQDTTSNVATAIGQDLEGQIWVGYEDGTVYKKTYTELVPWMPEAGHPQVPVNGLSFLPNGQLWLSTYGEGLYVLDHDRLYNFNMDDGLTGDDIYDMVQDDDGRIWVATDGGISICTFLKAQKKVLNYTRRDGLPDEIVHELEKDSEGNIWIGTYEAGFVYFDKSLDRIVAPGVVWPGGIINCFEIFEQKELWIGTEDNGLWKYDFQKKHLSPIKDEVCLANAKVQDLQKDKEGNIWISTNKVPFFSTNRLFEFVSRPPENIQAVATDKKGKIWLGTQNGLFSFLPTGTLPSKFVEHLGKLHMNVVSLYEDDFNHLWIGTFGDGLYCYNPQNGNYRHFGKEEGLTNGSILSLDGDGGELWIASLGGVTSFTYQSDIIDNGKFVSRNFNENSALGTNFIYKVFLDDSGKVWFGTDGHGLAVLQNGEIINYNYAMDVSSLSESEKKDQRIKTVYSITQSADGNIWFSTAREGLFKFDGKKFTHFTLENGLRQLEISCLEADKKGNIIIVHPDGIDLLNTRTGSIVYYGEEVGVFDFDPNLNAITTNKDGAIWVGGQKALIKYAPIHENLVIQPRTILKEVSVFLEPIPMERDSVFKHNENYLGFKYDGLWYTNPPGIRFQYMLEGYDLELITSRDNVATYSNLSPGKYTFKVRSTQNKVFTNEAFETYVFWVKEPIWKRVWFMVLCVGMALVLFYWYQKIRDQRLQKVNLLKKEKIESQFEALKSQISPHFLFNSFNTLITIIGENPKLAEQYVENLSDFYRSIMQYRDKELITLKEEMELVMNYRFLLEKRYEDHFRLDIKISQNDVLVVPLALQMLVENIVKHNVISKSQRLHAMIEYHGGDYIVIKNNVQKKITPEQSTRFGLQSIVKRYDLLTNRKVLISQNEKEFIVRLPAILKNT